MHDNCYKKDIWLWDQAWNSRHLKLTKKSKLNRDLNAENIFTDDRGFLENLSESSASTDDILNKLQINFDALFKKKHLLPLKIPHLPGYPAWYSKLCFPPRHNEWVPGPELISTGMQITPKLLQLTWNSLPLHYIKGNGWGYIVPYRSDIPIELEDMPVQELIKYCERFGLLCPCNTKEGDEKYTCRKLFGNVNSEIRNYFCKNNIGMSCGIIKLPHKDGGHLNVGNPLARDFINKFTGNELSGSCKYAHRVIEISRMLSYWRNNRDRIQNQLACWLNNKDLPLPLRSGQNIGAILPQVIVCGTLTRRAVEPTWMTASNAIVERVGSELRGIVQAPAGFSLVGADVDSQELWIASLLGDSHQAGIHGASPFGWMTLNGQKSDETDMHSVTAKVIGISRNHAKVLNYARIYGAGQKFAERLLRQFNPSMGANEANLKASKMYSMTKGSKIYKLKDNVLPEFKERIFHKASAHEVCTLYKKNLFDLFQPSIWVDGTESAMFNYLEEIAQKPSPETPFLRSKLSRALEPGIDNDDRHLPTRVNWVVQSGAVDFLHLMLVSMRWFLGPATRFCLSFHDEIRYLVHSEHKYKAALALHVTNLLTRSFCVKRLGMTDLPLSVAFFSSVEVDTVLRKESNDDNKTPSNPLGLLKGYGIPAGESLNIYEAIEKANGVIGIKK
ncbi:hypothetical protein AAG570_007825 [Ranatra chinensis]|uniref:DNA polymerase subunit gamma-1 n=1 Tax=Ranatra chinensis TaxID=642074 RepID=A0ABD0XVX3_9HEMI